MDLTTTYLGLKLRTPLVISASPLSEDVENIKRMEGAGAAAVVLYSLFEEQLRHDRLELHARLESVAFVDCRLQGADFRHVKLAGCLIRGASLDGVLGVEAMRGLRMPWPDVLASAGALAVALGIDVESD